MVLIPFQPSKTWTKHWKIQILKWEYDLISAKNLPLEQIVYVLDVSNKKWPFTFLAVMSSRLSTC